MTDAARQNVLQTQQRVVLVTGPSGAGRSTAINVLEDIGYEAIDNLPLSLLPRLLAGPPASPATSRARASHTRCVPHNILLYYILMEIIYFPYEAYFEQKHT